MLTVRAMAEADVAAVSVIRVTGWKAAYVGIIPQSHLDGMTVEEDTQQRRQHFKRPKADTADLVAVDTHGRVVGWACFGPFRGIGTSEATGELYALYVLPSLIGAGIGRTLLEAVHAHAHTHGFDLMRLWVLNENLTARRFCERSGYVADGAFQADDYDGVSVSEARYHRAL